MDLSHFILIVLNLDRLKESTIISESFVLISVGVALYNWKLLSASHRVLFFLLIWGFIADMKILFPALKPYNDHILGIYILTEVLVYVYFISEILNSDLLKKNRKYLYVLVVIMWLISYGKILILHEKPLANGFNDVASSLVLVILAAYQLLQLTKSEIPVFRQSDFWLLIGIFAYFMCCSFIFSFMAAEFRSKIWFLHSVFFVLKSVLFTIGFLLIRTDKKYIRPDVLAEYTH